jgi:hypothetical protein
MNDYQIQAPTRRCSATGRELCAGEKYYTALLDVAGQFVRQDYSSEAWQGPPAGAFSFWVGRVPEREESRKPRIDDELLFDCFRRLEGQNDADKVNFRYVVALLLMRRKRFKFEEAHQEGGQEYLGLRCVKTKTVYQVHNPRLTEAEMAAVQEEVFRVLGWEQA